VPPPPTFFKGPKVPFFVMKSALFVQANVAVNTKLKSEVPFLFGNFDVLKKIWSNLAISVWYDRKHPPPPPPPWPTFPGKIFRCPFQYPKEPLEVGAAPQSFHASYAPAHIRFVGVRFSCPTHNCGESCQTNLPMCI
jgi:hypothetical protein